MIHDWPRRVPVPVYRGVLIGSAPQVGELISRGPTCRIVSHSPSPQDTPSGPRLARPVLHSRRMSLTSFNDLARYSLASSESPSLSSSLYSMSMPQAAMVPAELSYGQGFGASKSLPVSMHSSAQSCYYLPPRYSTPWKKRNELIDQLTCDISEVLASSSEGSKSACEISNRHTTLSIAVDRPSLSP